MKTKISLIIILVIAAVAFAFNKLLNLSPNLKVDWIDKGYPMNE